MALGRGMLVQRAEGWDVRAAGAGGAQMPSVLAMGWGRVVEAWLGLAPSTSLPPARPDCPAAERRFLSVGVCFTNCMRPAGTREENETWPVLGKYQEGEKTGRFSKYT